MPIFDFNKKERIDKYSEDAATFLAEVKAEHTTQTTASSVEDIQFSIRKGPRFSRELPSIEQDELQAKILKSLTADDTPASLELMKQLKSTLKPTFSDHLAKLIKEKKMSDPTVYKSAHIDRRLFSKIMTDRSYKPAKDTVIAFVFALKLDEKEADLLLEKAGYVLSKSIDRDIVIEYFIKKKISNLNDINAVLARLGMKIVGQ